MLPKLLITSVVAFLAVLAVPLSAQEECTRIYGFTAEGSVRQRQFETLAWSFVKPENCREILHRLADEPNIAGTPGDRSNAEHIRDFLQNLGLETKIYEYQVYMSYARKVELVIEGKVPEVIRPGEQGFPEDPDSTNRDSMPPYIGFSPSGKVSGKVIYANYGLKKDFDFLSDMGIDVEGAIILARYGRAYRGNKIYEAQQRGAAAMILFSDPSDDGYMRGDVYPRGPMRPGDAPQRGSVNFMFKQPGDPLTLLEPALPSASRISPAEADLPSIPAIPLGYDDALKILRKIGGREVPQGWQGGLPLRYHVGPGPVTVRLEVEMDNAIRPIWNVVGVLPGTEFPNQWVLVGCHRDAWGHGALDPHSGNAATLESVRAIVTAAKKLGGLRRSLVVCSWDAEEFGMIGSVEWVEQFRNELEDKAVAYINTDAMISGPRFGASCTPTLRPMMRQVIEDCPYPDGRSLLQHWRDRIEPGAGEAPPEPSFGLFGGGSDHTGFLHHIGVPCAGGGFGGRQGVYHSAYDTIHWMEKYGDPGYKYHAAGSRYLVAKLSRLANAKILPFAPSQYGSDLRKYLNDLEKIDPNAAKPAREKLGSTLIQIDGLSLALEQELDKILQLSNIEQQDKLIELLNEKMLRFERSFIDREGIPRRRWYRHLLYAPDLSNGYSLLTLPGLSENVDNPDLYKQQLSKLHSALEKYKTVVAETLSIILEENCR